MSKKEISKKTYFKLLRVIKKIFPKFKIISKRSNYFMSWLNRTVQLFNKKFMTQYTTTIGYSIYTPDDWSKRSYTSRYNTMIHEMIHLQQFRKFGFIPYSILYIFIPLPVFLAYFRKKFEQEAYAINIILAYKQKGRKHVLSEAYKKNVIEQFCSNLYGYTWYSEDSIEEWLENFVKKIENKEITLKSYLKSMFK